MNVSIYVRHVHLLVSYAGAHRCSTHASKCLRLSTRNLIELTFVVQDVYVAVRVYVPSFVFDVVI